jgi:hypothetical protein
MACNTDIVTYLLTLGVIISQRVEVFITTAVRTSDHANHILSLHGLKLICYLYSY